MKLLLDSCVWGKACAQLTELGHDVDWAGSWQKDPGDEEILVRAHMEARILVTLDKDFGELAIIRQIPHSGIIRLVGFAARSQAIVCHQILSKYKNELELGAIVTADPSRVRIRPADS